MKTRKRQPKRPTAGRTAGNELGDLVQRLFFAEEVDPDLIDNPVVRFVLDSIRSTPLPKEPLE